MIYKKHILICDDDITRYPPIINNIKILSSLGCDITIFGYCKSAELKSILAELNVNYHETKVDKVQKSTFSKFLCMINHTKQVHNFIKKQYDNDTIVWIFGNENGWRLDRIIKNYRCILYLFEMPFFKMPIKYRLLLPFTSIKKNIQSAWRIVCCEYNRAKITEAIYNLKSTPYIIPNKPVIEVDELKNKLSEFISKDEVELLKNKKVLLYQGAIDNKKRRIDYICEAIKELDNNFIFCIMASESKDKFFLKEKYKNDRIIFLPFIPPPYHLLVTKKAYIGFLTYNTAENSSKEECLNLLYCAPNKIYEYSKFNIPMIGNNIPALKNTFEQFNAGISTHKWATEDIIQAIRKIEKNYILFSKGSKNFYDSTNNKTNIKSLIEKR